MLSAEMEQMLPPLLALDFDLAANAVLTDWEIEVRESAREGNAKVVSLSPEEAFNLL